MSWESWLAELQELDDGSIEFPDATVPPLTDDELRLLAADRPRPDVSDRRRPVPASRPHRRPSGIHWFDELEQAQLRRLVYQAFDLRESPYMVDACEAIIDWAERTLPDRLERAARREQA